MEQNSTATIPVANNNKQNKKKSQIIIAITSIIAICGIGIGIYGIVQSYTSNSEIENLRTQISEYEKSATTDVDNFSKKDFSTNDENQIDGKDTKDYTLLINKLKGATQQRYELVYISGGQRTAYNNISSEDDKYFILDTNKLGSADDLKEYDLVAALKPFKEQKINNMPEYASYNIYSNDDKLYLSQCESFSVEYFSGQEHIGHLVQAIQFDQNKEIPFAVDYICHYDGGNTQRTYHTAFYSLDVETGTIKEIEQYSTSDFTNS